MYHTIEVTGGVMKYSPEDHELISGLTIHITKDGYCRASGKGWVHRLIMKATVNDLVDHINNERNDNRRENLRFFSD